MNPYRYALNNPINSFDANGLWAGDVHSGVGRSDYGTSIWATQLGFSADVSKTIALADDGTDAYGNWAPVAGDPGRHFDTAHGGVDSRVLYANTELEKAIAQYKKGNRCEAYKSLGKGLHSAQDIIAHHCCPRQDWIKSLSPENKTRES